MKHTSHRARYPEQYAHRLCGKEVRIQSGRTFTVERVCESRFGAIVVDPTFETFVGYKILDVEEIAP